MSASHPAPDPRPVSTGGAWLGFGICVRAGFGVFVSSLCVGTAALVPVVVDAIDRQVIREAGAGGLPPQWRTIVDLWLELGTIVRPFAFAAGGAGIAIGVALFVAAFGLVRGGDLARRATRLLLVLDGAHAVAACAWAFVLCTTRVAEWNLRQVATAKALAASTSNGRMRGQFDLADSVWVDGVVYSVLALLTVAVVGILFWLAGRPFARRWCAARSPVASPAGAG